MCPPVSAEEFSDLMSEVFTFLANLESHRSKELAARLEALVDRLDAHNLEFSDN